MAIGGLWVPTAERPAFNNELKNVCLQYRLGSELKWSKVSKRYLEGYKAFVDVFLRSQNVNARVILVPHNKLDYCRFHGGDKELGFYKFYYRMLEPWVNRNAEYQILLDRKINSQESRYADLQRCLSYNANIRPVQTIESKDARIAQLCDIIVGCVAAANSNPYPINAKKELSDYIARQLGVADFSTFHTYSRAICKFNVFRIKLA